MSRKLTIVWVIELDSDTPDEVRVGDRVTITDRANPVLLNTAARLIGQQVKETLERELLALHVEPPKT